MSHKDIYNSVILSRTCNSLTHFSSCNTLRCSFSLHITREKNYSSFCLRRQVMQISAGQSWACCLNRDQYRCRFTCDHRRGCPPPPDETSQASNDYQSVEENGPVKIYPFSRHMFEMFSPHTISNRFPLLCE